MTHLTYSGLCCFLFGLFLILSTERIDERNVKAPIATSKVAWVFSGVLLTFLMCVNLQHFVTERDKRLLDHLLCANSHFCLPLAYI